MTATAQTADMTTTTGNRDMIAAYVRHLRQLGRAESTINTYRHILNRTDRELPYGLLSDDDELAEWLADLPARGTRAVYRAALTGFYAWAVREKWIDGDPSVDLPFVAVRRGIPRPVPAAQLRTILPALDGPVRLWSLLALRQGLRCIEIARLRWPQDVTEDALYVTGKGSYERSIPTHPDVWAALSACPPGPVADFAGGTERVRKYVSRRCRIEYDRLGQWTPHVTAHRLRHTFATHLIEAGVPTRVVQALMGHSKVSTTEIYTQVTPQAARAAVLRLPALLGT